MSSDISIRVRDIAKTYHMHSSPAVRLKQTLFPDSRPDSGFKALKNINFDVQQGEVVGIVGRNGSGKSTLLQLICGTLLPSHGEVLLHGRVSALLELGSGFDPNFTGKENVYLNASILGLSRQEIKRRYNDIVAFSGIGDFINQPVKTYSSGMYVRLAFAVAVSVDPDILIVDEALAVGDDDFKRKCYARIQEIRNNGCSILFVSHSAGTVVNLCDRAVLLDHGEQLLVGDPKRVVSMYQKLIKAPLERQALIRSEIKAGRDPEIEVTLDDGDAVLPQNEANRVISDQPESAVWFESQGARISNPRICSGDGKQAELLWTGKEYVFSFDVLFDADASKVGFAMGIRTIQGVRIGGAQTRQNEDMLIDSVKSGYSMRLGFKFTCLLRSGTYFFNVGVSSMIDGEKTSLHRGLDILMCKVVSDTGIATGMIDLNCRPIFE